MQKQSTMTNKKLYVLAREGQRWAREWLVGNNLPFVRKVANSFWGKKHDWNRSLGIEAEVLCQEECIALNGCVDRFEPSCGNKFLPYAAPAIRNAMLDTVAGGTAAALLFCGRPIQAGLGAQLSAERGQSGASPCKNPVIGCLPGCFSGLALPMTVSTT